MVRQKNLRIILNELLKDSQIKLCCFQEVNHNNIDMLREILIDNNFTMLEKFAMKTEKHN